MTDDVYERLTEAFEVTFRDTRGGATFDYITGEQCISRLNEVLGVGRWNFRILEHGVHAEADEAWVLAELTATITTSDGEADTWMTVTRQQFGSQKVKRSRSSGVPLDIGFDLKGAATDALKKCASLLGVGLYLWHKEGGVAPQAAGSDGAAAISSEAGSTLCSECGEALTETRFKDGDTWAPAHLAQMGQRKHQRVLCMTHYREANAAKRRAEEALQQVPF